MIKTEILAPAGSYETMQAAFRAGADAVYLAGQSFGARAFADNLDKAHLIQAIDEAHMRGKKLYLTVNTLLKENELKEQLKAYLTPLYEAGLDAVIVQDFGVLKMIHEQFSGLDIHASTQMTVTDGNFAKWLSQFGVTRVVPARELSLKEIRRMKAESGLEIECFVHGALCYCYSGQCLLSSMIGGRSGNRGRCAQPCRLPYELISDRGQLSKKGENYLLSPKDIAALSLIPDLIDAGIDSLKIEGRMKRPEYAALVSSLYRKYVNLYETKGRDGFFVDEADIRDLMDLYNRGGFTEGYYKQHNGRAMMSVDRPNHIGTKAAKVLSVKNREICLKALEMLHPGDVIEYIGIKSAGAKRQELTLKTGADTGGILNVKGFLSGVKAGDVLYRTRNQSLIDSVADVCALRENKEKLYGTLTISKDLPVKMTVEHRGIEASVCGETASAAANRPLCEADVRARMEKTGNTPYEFEKLDIFIDEDVYVSIRGLNQLRRDAIEALEAARRSHYARKLADSFKNTELAEAAVCAKTDTSVAGAVCASSEAASGQSVSVLLGNRSQLKPVLLHKGVSLIYMEAADFAAAEDKQTLVREVHEAGKQLYIALPHVFRDDIQRRCMPEAGTALSVGADGFLVRNMEALIAVRNIDRNIPIVADASVYTFNSLAKDFVRACTNICVTAPVELNERELRQRGCEGDEIIVYGYMPLMVSAQCPMKTTGNCLKEKQGIRNPGTVYLKDRKGERFKTAAFCKYCYSVIYNSKPLQLADELAKISRMGFLRARVSLTSENERQISDIIDDVTAGFVHKQTVPNRLEAFTKGHFKRGVE